MKIALFGEELLETKALRDFFQERNIGSGIVSGKEKEIQNELAIENCVFSSIPDTLVVFDTKTKKWKRYYFNLFTDEETDVISVLAEDINQSIDRMNARYGKRDP
ncbi:hypothetical protein [uncultured Dubosiella sp.]|uniref:hypothetical protein n=1 Tax=uncultured Dubosiella sp. TaxID=1937011 RepID=UPI00259AEC6A|nr:hypothetical protein [uncultured Dubosiella sp.]